MQKYPQVADIVLEDWSASRPTYDVVKDKTGYEVLEAGSELEKVHEQPQLVKITLKVDIDR